MELEAGNSTAGAATAASHATHQHAVANNDATADKRPSDAGVAYPAVVATLDNELCFTLTVGQARAIFAERNRKVPADRTLQNYCVEGHVVAQKIKGR